MTVKAQPVPYPNIEGVRCTLCDRDITGKDVYFHMVQNHDWTPRPDPALDLLLTAYMHEMNEIARSRYNRERGSI